MTMRWVCAVVVAAAVLSAGAGVGSDPGRNSGSRPNSRPGRGTAQLATPVASPVVKVPAGIPEKLWATRADAASLTPQRIALGEDLFNDPILSADETVSCASCHDPARGYADSHPIAIGARKQRGIRNVPTLLNAVFSDALFWDGRARDFADQVRSPLQNPVEMGPQTLDDVVRRVYENRRYRRRFAIVFPEKGLTLDTLLNVLVSFERTLLSGDSSVDRFLAGDRTALSAAAARGWNLFRGRAGCVQCHTYTPDGPFFTDFGFHNTGIAARRSELERLIRLAEHAQTPSDRTRIAAEPAASELGRFRVTGYPADIGAFKTPPLRDVALTAPYMHDGSIATLSEVVAYYNAGGHRHPHLSRRLAPLNLDRGELADLVAFLESLTSAEACQKAESAKARGDSGSANR